MIRRYSLLSVSLVILLLILPLTGLCASSEEKILRSRTDTYNGLKTIGEYTYMYYAQNSPEWRKIGLGESGTVGDSMCAATALSNVIVNSVPYRDIASIADISRYPIRIDSHNVAHLYGKPARSKFLVQNKYDYFRFLPLCLGNYASGNNRIGCTNPRSTSYFSKVLDAYDLEYEESRDLDLCLEYIEEGALVVSCTGGKASPIAPKSGHYFVLADIIDGYVYCIDSYCRDTYEYDSNHIIEIVEPGIIRVPAEKIRSLCIYGSSFAVWPRERESYTPELYANLMRESAMG